MPRPSCKFHLPWGIGAGNKSQGLIQVFTSSASHAALTCTFGRCAWLHVCSEAAIAAIEARPNSPEWLQEEVARTRKGLMQLRQNVVLLRNSDEPDSFFPVSSLSMHASCNGGIDSSDPERVHGNKTCTAPASGFLSSMITSVPCYTGT